MTHFNALSSLAGSVEAIREWVRPWYLRHLCFPLFPSRRPAAFECCWEFPAAVLDPDPATSLLIVWPMNDWHGRIQRGHHLVRGLAARGVRCIVVNHHLGREFPSRPRRSEAVRLHSIERNVWELHVHLTREPVYHHRRLRAEESAALTDAVLSVIRASGSKSIAQLASFPVWREAALAVRAQGGAALVYDCHDLLAGFGNIATEVVEQEHQLVLECDLLVCSSEALMERWRSAERRILLRNATDQALVAQLQDQSPSRDPVTIGYVGAVDWWFDAAGFRAAAEAHPEWRFEVAGRIENAEVEGIGDLPNIHLLGEIPFARLCELLPRFSVGMIPFQMNPLIEATDPIKVYEYFAAGLPVVAARLPEVQRFGALLQTYEDAPGLVRALEVALEQDSATLQMERKRIAQSETWDQRTEDLLRELQRLW